MPLDPAFLSPGQRRLPGILGGLGPLAHIAFEREVLRQSRLRGARGDRDHPVWLLASGSATPGRTAALLEGAESPVRHLVAYARLLEAAGADALFVACNTAHAWHAEVQQAIGIPWAHLMDLTAEHLARTLPRAARVGILGTDGTLRSGLYHRALAARDLVPVAPPLESVEQASVRSAIDDPSVGIKATGAEVAAEARQRLLVAAGWCVAQGAEVIVLGCTEVSVGLDGAEVRGAGLVDPLAIAALALLDVAFGRLEPSALRRTADRERATSRRPSES